MGGLFVAGGGLGGVLVITVTTLVGGGASLPRFMKRRTPTNTRETTTTNTHGNTDFSFTTTVVTAGIGEAMIGGAPTCFAGCDVPPELVEAAALVDAFFFGKIST